MNETDGIRSAENVKRVRAVWFDDDAGNVDPSAFPLPPSVVVNTSPNKHHLYWLVSDRWDADANGREDFRKLMGALISMGSDPNAKDLSRVLRLPGTYHHKTASPHLVRIIVPASGEPKRYTRQELLGAFRIEPVESAPVISDGTAFMRGRERRSASFDLARVSDALAGSSSEDRAKWIKFGMALKRDVSPVLGEKGAYQLWEDWSRGSGKFNLSETKRQWSSFRDKEEGVGLGTLLHLADLERPIPSLPIASEFPESEAAQAGSLADQTIVCFGVQV